MANDKSLGLQNLDRLGWVMDDLFRIPVLGWRFGLDALIGLVPGLGDTSTSLVSFYILAAAVRYRVPKITMLRMGLNIGLTTCLVRFQWLVMLRTRGGSRIRRISNC